jgi:hypothetical protein
MKIDDRSGLPTPFAAADTEARISDLYNDIHKSLHRFAGYAALNHGLFNILFWLSVAFGLTASFIGAVAGGKVSAIQVSALAAIATGLQVASRQARFHEKANLHDRRVIRLRQFLRLLYYQLPNTPQQTDIDKIVEAYNQLDDQMAAELLAFASDTPPGATPPGQKDDLKAGAAPKPKGGAKPTQGVPSA